jgi:hypothetical protein
MKIEKVKVFEVTTDFEKIVASIDSDGDMKLICFDNAGPCSSVFMNAADSIELARAILKHHGLGFLPHLGDLPRLDSGGGAGG